MATKTTKTTKKSTKTAATRTARTTAKKTSTAGKRACASKTCKAKSNETHPYTFVALSLCFIITAMIATIIMIGTKLNNDALAKNLENDRNGQGTVIIYADPAEETPEQ